MYGSTWLPWLSIIFGDIALSFRLTFLNKCDEIEKQQISEFYQRAFGDELPESVIETKK